MPRWLTLPLLCLLLFAMQCTSSKDRYGIKMNKLQSRETTPMNFLRLVVMRLIFGFAYLLGVGNRLDGVMGGIFVPPGMRDEDDDDDEYEDDYEEDGFMDYAY